MNDIIKPQLDSANQNVSLDESLFPALLNAIAHPLLIISNTGQIKYVNSAAENFFEMGAPILLRQKIGSLVLFGSPLLALIEQVYKNRIAVNEYEIQFEIPRLHVTKIVDIQAKLLETNGSDSDDGNMSVMFIERGMANMIESQISSRNATKSISNMAEILAHEIKNPLSGIRGAAQLLGATASSEDKALTSLICDETDRICNLIDQMEQFSDGRLPDFESINIHVLIDHVKKLAVNGFGRHVKFVEHYDPSLPQISGNKDQLIQVLLNIVKNACEALEDVPNATIKITTAYKAGLKLKVPNREKLISLPFELTIEDNGNGIDPLFLPHIYDAFVSNKTGGKGLGLALVAKIIADHSAVIDYVGDKSGAKFRILFPLLSNIE
ncbi:MAG: ATP-binding protein [Hyphomicrobiales bacterium]